MSDLLPCPFCGGDAKVVTRDVEPQGDPWYGSKVERLVECDSCACTMFDRYWHEGFHDPEAAIAAWNRRAPPAQPADAVERVDLPGVNDDTIQRIQRIIAWYDECREVHYSAWIDALGTLNIHQMREILGALKYLYAAAPQPAALSAPRTAALDAAAARIAELEKALRPFARLGKATSVHWRDGYYFALRDSDERLIDTINVDDLRHAAAALPADDATGR
jgi:hypothetical protein